MKKIYFLTALFAASVLFSCKKDKQENERPAKDLVLTAAEQQKANADNAFTIKLFKSIYAGADANKNFMVSPLSVSMAVGMTSNGASAQTLDDIRNTMEFKNFPEQQINSYYNKLISELPELDPKATLNIANSIWYRNTFTPLPAFLQTNSSNYKATAEGLDFSSAAAKDKINKWVSDKTQEKIPTIIDNIPVETVMYLINAVYFKSTWKYQFDKSKTAKNDFFITPNTKVQADFMTAKATVNTKSFADASVYELPYGNEKYSMVIVLPNEGKTVTDIAATVDTTKWKTWTNGLQSISTDIRLPKFKFSYEKKLNADLIDLGMGIAFSSNANFTRINANGGLSISEVKHKTFVEVNEEGTEAAAVTSVGIEFTSVGPSFITINRPFLFAIREMKTGLILFTGVVNNPLLTE